MDNVSQQLDEIEALKSIFGEEWQVDSVPEYPSSSLPRYELLAPNLHFSQKKNIEQRFQNLYETEGGGPLIYQMIMIVEDVVKKSQSNTERKPVEEEQIDEVKGSSSKCSKNLNVVHGSTILDRKSVFQGHVCEVKSKEEVNAFMELLLENKKIANATHNISAYRILLPNNVVLQDCDDDGENKASSRVLELLQTLKLNNVMVVISRWYGGIQLGPDRFRHINNAARQALVEAGFVKS